MRYDDVNDLKQQVGRDQTTQNTAKTEEYPAARKKAYRSLMQDRKHKSRPNRCHNHHRDEDDKQQNHQQSYPILGNDCPWAYLINDIETSFKKNKEARTIKGGKNNREDAQEA